MGVTLSSGPLVEASPAIMQAWCTDMGQQVHDYPTIADRYGWPGEKEMFSYMLAHPAICRRIKEIRAIWESDENVVERVRKLAGHTVLEALPNTAQVMFDPNNAPALRLDALKAHARIAGLDAMPKVAGDGGTGAVQGTKFSVEIVFSDGKAESIKTIDGETSGSDRRSEVGWTDASEDSDGI